MQSEHMPMPTLAFPGDSAYVDVPFTEVSRNHIVIPIRLEGSAPLRGACSTPARAAR